MSDLAKIRPLLDAAAKKLERATSAAEVLDARQQAGLAYTQAKAFARLAKIRKAHDAVLTTCRRMQADALGIENAAQCRLANEYDVAQKGGKVAGANEGRPRRSDTERLPSASDIGLTRKEVHEARIVRDAEKADPGVIKRTIDAKVEAGEEPTRADVMRAAKEATAKPEHKRKTDKPKNEHKSTRGGRLSAPTPELDRTREYVRADVAADKPIDKIKVAKELGVSPPTVDTAIQAEKAVIKDRAANTAMDPSHLSKTAQEKLDAAIRAHKKKMDAEYQERITAEVRQLVMTTLKMHNEAYLQSQKIIKARKGVMTRAIYKKILACLHPDRVQDPVLKTRYQDAFATFTELEKILLDEKESPTTFRQMPRTMEELRAHRAKAEADRKAKRAASSVAVRPR